MKYKKIVTLILAGLMMLGMTACAEATAPAVTEPPASTPTPTQAPAPVTGTGLCSNPLFPVVEGATWTYSTTGGPTGTFTHTDTITDVRDDGFTLTTQFQDLSRTQEWSCTPEGLLALSLGGNSAGISSQGVTAEFNTTDATGITLPSTITPGLQWSNSLTLQGNMTLPGDQNAQANGTLSINFQEMGSESVTVPAGSFNANKIQFTSTFDIKATFQGVEVPVTISGTGTLWYMPGVGLVKTMESGNVGGETITSTTELQSFNIP